jgi:hypothetical protein
LKINIHIFRFMERFPGKNSRIEPTNLLGGLAEGQRKYAGIPTAHIPPQSTQPRKFCQNSVFLPDLIPPLHFFPPISPVFHVVLNYFKKNHNFCKNGIFDTFMSVRARDDLTTEVVKAGETIDFQFHPDIGFHGGDTGPGACGGWAGGTGFLGHGKSEIGSETGGALNLSGQSQGQSGANWPDSLFNKWPLFPKIMTHL